MAEAGAGPTRCGFVALIGAPNAGKSTLLNALVGSKVSIVSRKAQTTRAIVRGIAVEGAAQIVFVDTPGIFKPKRRLDRAMVTSAWGGAGDADAVALLLDVRKGLDEESEAILEPVARAAPAEDPHPQQDRRDRARKAARPGRRAQRAPALRPHLHGLGPDRRRHRRSEAPAGGDDAGRPVALSGGPDLGCAAAHARRRDHAREDLRAPARGAALPIDGRDRPVAGTARRLRAHRADRSSWSARASARSCSARAARPSRRSAKRRAGRSPRSPRRPVHLFLFVKVRENWEDDPERYREMGLEFPKG